jgi:ubiquinone/menaquinone biosynthesis C-methylase UbiE
MNKLPEVNGGFTDLYNMLMAPIRSKLLLTAIELKVFNELTSPTTAEIVAQVIGSDHPGNTGLFLDALVAIQLVEKKRDHYQNTPLAQTFLVEGSPTYLGQFFANQLLWHKPVLENLSTLVREGPPPQPEMGVGSEEVWNQMALAMGQHQRSGIAQQLTEVISGLPEFPSLKKMLDLGGGSGLIGISIVAAHPKMKGVIFDRPAIAKVTEKFIAEYDMEDWVDFLGGDYTCDSIGEGYDLILACATLNFVKKDLDAFLRKLYGVLNPGGLLIAVSDGLTDERTRPELMVISWLSTALMGTDMSFERGFVADSMLRAGFESVRSRSLETSMGPMDVDIARKTRRPEPSETKKGDGHE